jgi:hypothetical protein
MQQHEYGVKVRQLLMLDRCTLEVSFVTGSWYYNTCIKTAEIYDPVSNTWIDISNMNLGRYGHQPV